MMALILLSRVMSLSARRAWIEIGCWLWLLWLRWSLSARRAWIEIWARHTAGPQKWSLSARRAWIEICCPCRSPWLLAVALRKESVDRNTQRRDFKRLGLVALRKESVDRNDAVQIVIIVVHASLSARRAWIEIICTALKKYPVIVALRKESVDRNVKWQQGEVSYGSRSPQGERG